MTGTKWQVDLNRSDAVHFYWLLEAYENYWVFTTKPANGADPLRTVEINSTVEMRDEAEKVLRGILAEVPHMDFRLQSPQIP